MWGESKWIELTETSIAWCAITKLPDFTLRKTSNRAEVLWPDLQGSKKELRAEIESWAVNQILSWISDLVSKDLGPYVVSNWISNQVFVAM